MNAVKAARQAYNDAQAAKQAAKNATTAQDMQVKSMLTVGPVVTHSGSASERRSCPSPVRR